LAHADLALDAFGAFWVVPKIGIKGLAGQVFYVAQSVIDVKDTSLRPPAFLSVLLTVR
jgi:hypothetical protein